MTLLDTNAHRPVAFDRPPPSTAEARIRLRTVDGRYLHQDLSAPTLIDRSTWAWRGTLPQMQRALKALSPELRRQLIPTNLAGLPLSLRRSR